MEYSRCTQAWIQGAGAQGPPLGHSQSKQIIMTKLKIFNNIENTIFKIYANA